VSAAATECKPHTLASIMKIHSKKGVILTFGIILIIEFYIYFSEYDLTTYLTIPISFATSIFSLFLINNSLKNRKLKFFFSSIVVLLTIMFFIWEIILASLKSANEISQTWNINDFEIHSIKRSFEGSEPSFYTLKKNYCFGLIYREMDISFPENFIQNGNKCILEFVDANLAFDLCNLKQEK
jgi:hypothetical protein